MRALQGSLPQVEPSFLRLTKNPEQWTQEICLVGNNLDKVNVIRDGLIAGEEHIFQDENVSEPQKVPNHHKKTLERRLVHMQFGPSSTSRSTNLPDARWVPNSFR